MKTTTPILLATLILFQSCYSYKKVDIQNIKIDTSKKYAIKTSKTRLEKGKIIKITNNNITLMKRKKTIIIPKNHIRMFTVKEFINSRTKNLLGVIMLIISSITIPKLLEKNINFTNTSF